MNKHGQHFSLMLVPVAGTTQCDVPEYKSVKYKNFGWTSMAYIDLNKPQNPSTGLQLETRGQQEGWKDMNNDISFIFGLCGKKHENQN